MASQLLMSQHTLVLMMTLRQLGVNNEAD